MHRPATRNGSFRCMEQPEKEASSITISRLTKSPAGCPETTSLSCFLGCHTNMANSCPGSFGFTLPIKNLATAFPAKNQCIQIFMRFTRWRGRRMGPTATVAEEKQPLASAGQKQQSRMRRETQPVAVPKEASELKNKGHTQSLVFHTFERSDAVTRPRQNAYVRFRRPCPKSLSCTSASARKSY